MMKVLLRKWKFYFTFWNILLIIISLCLIYFYLTKTKFKNNQTNYGNHSNFIKSGQLVNFSKQNILKLETFDSYFKKKISKCCAGKLETIEEFSLGQHFDEKIPLCPRVPPNLKFTFDVDTSVYSFEELTKKYKTVDIGGQWNPLHCTARDKVAIVVPYRDRDEHLKIFLNNMHMFLQKQLINYAIYIIEQLGDIMLNRGLLRNIGFIEANKLGLYDCIIFNDIDNLPLNEKNIYSCPHSPRHMAVAIDKFNFTLPYHCTIGGVSAWKIKDFYNVNGFSNQYWGWGGEDDDLVFRLAYRDYIINRYSSEIARYKTLPHVPSKPNPNRIKKLNKWMARLHYDGLSDMKKYYKIMNITTEGLFTKISVEVLEKNY